MRITVEFEVCNGCGLRYEGDAAPPTWLIVIQPGITPRSFCTAECMTHNFADATVATPANIRRARRFSLTASDLLQIEHLAGGMSNSEIALAMHRPASTIKNRLVYIMQALNAHDRTQTVIIAAHYGLIDVRTLGDELTRPA